jgi:hypothetical protein
MTTSSGTRKGLGINGSSQAGPFHSRDDGKHGPGTAKGSLTIGGTRRAPAVALYVYEAADVDLTLSETLRLSRLVYSPTDGYVLEHHGDLIRPGTTKLRLEVGVFHFKSINDVRLRIDPPDAVLIVTPRAGADDTASGTGGSNDE